jgi:toxin ParE1/3/4
MYLAEEDVQIATDFVADLHDKMEWIALSGFTGVPRDWIRPGLRALPYRERCIYFRVTDTEVFILRVLHGRQDITQQEFSG